MSLKNDVSGSWRSVDTLGVPLVDGYLLLRLKSNDDVDAQLYLINPVVRAAASLMDLSISGLWWTSGNEVCFEFNGLSSYPTRLLDQILKSLPSPWRISVSTDEMLSRLSALMWSMDGSTRLKYDKVQDCLINLSGRKVLIRR